MKPGMILYREELTMLLMMPPEEQSEAISLLAKRFLLGEEPQTDNMRVDLFLQIAIPKQEADDEAYNKRIEAARNAGKMSAASRASVNDGSTNVNDRSTTVDDRSTSVNKPEPKPEPELKPNQKPVVVAFRPPTLDEVKEYCNERNSGISAEHFYDYYSSNGWQVGRTKMKDWKAAVRTWERTEFKRSEPKKTTTLSDGDFISHEWDYDKLQAIAEARGLQR